MTSPDHHPLPELVDRLQAAVDSPWTSQMQVFCRKCEGVGAESPIELLHLRRLAIELLLRGAFSGERLHSQLPFCELARARCAQDVAKTLRRALRRESTGPALEPAPDGFRRWSNAVNLVVVSPHDPRTLTMWAGLARVSPETLRTWCKSARVPVKGSLDLSRVLRAIRLAHGRSCRVECFLDVAHPRTLRRLLRLGGILDHDRPPSLVDVIYTQRLVTDEPARAALIRMLRGLNGLSAS